MTKDNAYPDDNPKTAIGVTKVPLHLCPPVALHYAALAFADGAQKYGPYNWRDKTVSSSVYVAAAKRHLDAWWDGENQSQDAKVHHLGHVLACVAILLDAESVGKLNDDRPTKGAAAELQAEYAAKNTEGKKESDKQLSRTSKEEHRASDAVESRRLSDLQADVLSGVVFQGIDGIHRNASDRRVVRYDSAGNRLD